MYTDRINNKLIKYFEKEYNINKKELITFGVDNCIGFNYTDENDNYFNAIVEDFKCYIYINDVLQEEPFIINNL